MKLKIISASVAVLLSGVLYGAAINQNNAEDSQPIVSKTEIKDKPLVDKKTTPENTVSAKDTIDAVEAPTPKRQPSTSKPVTTTDDKPFCERAMMHVQTLEGFESNELIIATAQACHDGYLTEDNYKEVLKIATVKSNEDRYLRGVRQVLMIKEVAGSF